MAAKLVVAGSIFDFPEVMLQPELAIGFAHCQDGTSVIAIWQTSIMPCLCNECNSSDMSPLEFMSTGSFSFPGRALNVVCCFNLFFDGNSGHVQSRNAFYFY